MVLRSLIDQHASMYIVAAAFFFLAAGALALWKRPNPVGKLVLVAALALTGAALSMMAAVQRLTGAFEVISASPELEIWQLQGALLESFGESIHLIIAGRAALLILMLAAGAGWVIARGRLSSDGGNLAVVVMLMFLGIFHLGSYGLAHSALETAICVPLPEDYLELPSGRDLPPGLEAMVLEFFAKPTETVAGEISSRLLSSALTSMLSTLILCILIAVGVVLAFFCPEKQLGSPRKSPAPVFGLGLILVFVVAAGATWQIWRVSVLQSWLSRIGEIVDESRAKAASLRVPSEGEETADVWSVRVDPVYPREAKQLGYEGQVIVEANIDPQGNVVEAKAVYGHALLNQAALDAVRQWKLSPEMLPGVTENQKMYVPVDFKIDGRPHGTDAQR